MSYLVAHVQKLKASDLRGMQIHNQRESQNLKNPEINPEMTKNNYDLHQSEDINYNQAVKQRLVEGYQGEKAIRKDAAVCASFLVSSDKAFFQSMPPERQREYFQAAYDHLCEKYGKENVISAKVHVDETTPHMHMTIVPLTEDGRLCAKELLNRQRLRELQEELPKALQQKGFEIERGRSVEGRDVKHLDVNEFKAQSLIQKQLEIEQLEKELSEKKAILSESMNKIEESVQLQRKIEAFEKNKLEEARSRLIGSDVRLNPAEFKLLCDYAKAGVNQEQRLTEVRNKLAAYEFRLEKDREATKLGQRVETLCKELPGFNRQLRDADLKQRLKMTSELERKRELKRTQQLEQPQKKRGLSLGRGD